MMFMKAECMPCFLKQVLKELEGSDLEDDKKDIIMRDMLDFLSKVDFDQAPVDISFLMHERMMELGVSSDPYLELKDLSTSQALHDLKDIEEEVDNSEDPLKDSAYAAIAGNVIDFGAKNMLDLHEVLENARTNGFMVDDWEKFKEKISRADVLYYFLDNSGEVVFDHLFMRKLFHAYPRLSIKAVVKRIPLLNDVTREDVFKAGMVNTEGVEILEVPGKGWIQPEDIKRLKGEGIVFLSKGQGNYESLSSVPGVFFLLVAKCELVAGNLNADVGDMVFKLNH